MPKVVLIVAAIGVILSWTMLFLLPGRPSSLNEFGDSFGIVNALFSGLGLVAIVYSLHLQNHEIKASSDQIDRQGQTIDALRGAIAAQTDKLQASVDAQTAQAGALKDLVEQYRLQLEPLTRRVEIAERQLAREEQSDIDSRAERLRADMREAWLRLEKQLPEVDDSFEQRREAYKQSGFCEAVEKAVEFDEGNPRCEILAALPPSSQIFLRTHLYRQTPERQVYFSKEAKALAGRQALGTVEPGHLQNFLKARDLYDGERA